MSILLKSFVGWLKANLSSDPSSSNSRVLQTLIATNVTAMMWVVLAKAKWLVSDNARLIIICLITAGAGSYIANKITGKLTGGENA